MFPINQFSLPPLTRQQARSIDVMAIQRFGMLGLVLMENAGRGAAEWIHQQYREGPIAILCGKGNNAGDGYVIARHLQLLQRKICIIQCAPPQHLTGDALHNWMIAEKAGLPTLCLFGDGEVPIDSVRHVDSQKLISTLQQHSVILDCLLGTGAVGELREPFATVVSAANQCQAIRVAIDIPSGLDCDSGQPSRQCFRADSTCTFVAPKVGFLNPQSQSFVGRLHVVGIGVPQKLLDDFSRDL